MENLRKKTLSTLVMFAVCFFFFNTVALADDTDKIIAGKTINNTRKTWTIKFNSAVDFQTVKNSIKLTDKNNNSLIYVSVTQGQDENSVIVSAPLQGYKVGHTYELKVDKDLVKSKKGDSLKRTAVMDFTVAEGNGDTASGNDNTTGGNSDTTNGNTASVKVEVPVIEMLSSVKRITLNSTGNKDIKKFKIEGTDKVFNLGESGTFMIGTSNTTIYFYKEDGTTLVGKGTLDVSKSNNNVSVIIK